MDQPLKIVKEKLQKYSLLTSCHPGVTILFWSACGVLAVT